MLLFYSFPGPWGMKIPINTKKPLNNPHPVPEAGSLRMAVEDEDPTSQAEQAETMAESDLLSWENSTKPRER